MSAIPPAQRSIIARSKQALGRALFALSDFERIHIIGCSRSGTTMFHLAMTCFQNTTISEEETEVEHPYLAERLRILMRTGYQPGPKFYVTKRIHGWFQPEHIERLLRATRNENIGLIHLVRDPRDVLLSRYAGSDQPYVSPQHWYDSIVAADTIFSSVDPGTKTLTLRYEDLVLAPQSTQKKIEDRFGMRQDPNAFSIDRVRDNFERSQIQFKDFALRNLKGLRNAEAGSIGQWKKNGNVQMGDLAPQIAARLSAFSAEHGYEPI